MWCRRLPCRYLRDRASPTRFPAATPRYAHLSILLRPFCFDQDYLTPTLKVRLGITAWTADQLCELLYMETTTAPDMFTPSTETSGSPTTSFSTFFGSVSSSAGRLRERGIKRLWHRDCLRSWTSLPPANPKSYFLAPPAGFEPATHGLGNRCSIP